MRKMLQNPQQYNVKYTAEIQGYALDFCHIFYSVFLRQKNAPCEHSLIQNIK